VEPVEGGAYQWSGSKVCSMWNEPGDYPLKAPIAFHTPPRFEAFCRSRPNHWQTLAVVERDDPAKPDYDEEFPLHVHALTISTDRKNGWNTRNARFWDFEGRHPNILPKSLREGPGGIAARTSFHYLWKHVGEMGEDIEDLMAGELTEESLEGILERGRRGPEGRGRVPKRTWRTARRLSQQRQ
jgi:hypothetical protein